ncbi:hypothetical protein [Undibacterium danionis]|uniref:Uncharacterized protein n=1 Tax=Undibacterium danionis TaxID=1812100 RepID=A0ABV6IJA0_9BURK
MSKSKYQLSPIFRVTAGILATAFLTLFAVFLWDREVRVKYTEVLVSLCVCSVVFAYGAIKGESPACIENPEILSNWFRDLISKK